MMRALQVFLAFLVLALAGPASAALCDISTGANCSGVSALVTGGSASGASTTVTSSTTAVDIPSGSLIIVGASVRSSGVSISSCYDSANGGGVLYSHGQTSTTNSYAVQTFYYVTSIDVPVGSTITCTYGSTSASKSIEAVAFVGSSSTPFDSASTTATGTGTGTLTIGPTGTLGCAKAVVIGNLTYGNAGTITEGTGFTSLGTITTNSLMHMGYQVVTATTAMTYTPSTTATSTAWAAQLQVFDASSCTGSTAKHTALLLGVGL